MFQSIGNILGTTWSILGGIISIIALIIGLITLFFGRKLFWIFAALIGFSFGLVVSAQLFQNFTQLARFFFSALLGAGFAILAIYAEKFAIILTGLFGFGMAGYFVAGLFNSSEIVRWVLFLISGLLGAILISKHLEWALVAISVVLGAIMASAGLNGLTQFNFFVNLLIFIALLVSGFSFQSSEKKQVANGQNNKVDGFSTKN